MAGKLHRNFENYARQQDGFSLAPGDKRARAYAEGYVAYRNGQTRDDNPHPASSDDDSGFQSWLYGFQDGERGEPATHVGRPDAVAAPPPPDPDPDPAARPWLTLRTHAELDQLATDLRLIVPTNWDDLMVAEKRDWLDEIHPQG
jgi:hypothetical protein